VLAKPPSKKNFGLPLKTQIMTPARKKLAGANSESLQHPMISIAFPIHQAFRTLILLRSCCSREVAAESATCRGVSSGEETWMPFGEILMSENVDFTTKSRENGDFTGFHEW